MEDKKTIIDTHFHIWDAAVLTLPTLKMFEGQLRQKYTFEDYQEATKGLNITRSYYVEVDAIKEQHKLEAEMIINMCRDDSNSIAGATIAGDMSSQAFKEYIVPFAKQRVVRSVRHNLFAADASVSRSSIFRENVDLLGTLGLMCDLVMPAEKMMDGVELVRACPETLFVVDHCGLCPILSDQATKEHWRQGISAYAEQTNALCKVSECGFTCPDYRWKVPDVVDIIHHCIDSFGEDRIVYGTNWPICEITSTISHWLEALNVTLQDFPDHYAEKLFSKNAERFYG